MAKPKFQHRHYEAIAALLSDMRQTADDLFTREVLDGFERNAIALFTRDNPHFNPDRFAAACRSDRQPVAAKRMRTS